MRQRLLLGVGVVLMVGALAVGAIAATSGGSLNPVGGLGMMGGNRPGMMGGYGPAMMGGLYGQPSVGGAAITMDQAQSAVEQYVARYGSSDLAVDELIEFRDNFYAIVKEKSTGTGAFEVLVNKANGAVSPEPGPNMMWNTRYGMMAGAGMMGGGMMGGFVRATGTMTISKDRAGQIAQSWLDANQAGAKIEEPDAFYGYYTVHFTKDGKVAGMLSVNGYSGQVWYHSWHGDFVQEREVGA